VANETVGGESLIDALRRRAAEGEIDVTVARLESLGSELVAYLAPAGMAADTLLTARLERRAALTEGGATRVSVDIDLLYFFDPESGAALT